VNKFTKIDTFTDLVSVLLVASTDTEHGRVSHDLIIDPLLGGRDLEGTRGDDKADTIGGEDPTRHTGFLGDHEAFRLNNVRGNDSLVVSDSSTDARVFLGGDPGVVDLLVLESEALPRGVGVKRGAHVDDEALLTELLDGLETVDISKASIRSLTKSHTTIETEGELLRDSAVAGSIDLGPGGSASTVAQERMIKEANALLITISSLSDDERGSLERVAALPWHGTMARLADDLNLDLHTTTLTAVDTKRTELKTAITSALGVDDGIGEHLSGDVLTLENVTADVHWCTTIIVLLSNSAVRADDAATEGAKRLELEHDLGGDDLRDDTSKLISRTTTKDEVLPLLTRRKVAKLLAHLLLINLGGIGETVVAINTLTDTLVPGRAKRVHSISVTIKVKNLLLSIRDTILTILDNPDKVTHRIKIDILRAFDRADLNNALLQVLQARKFVIAHTTLGILITMISRDSDSFTKQFSCKRTVLLSKFCNTCVKRHLYSIDKQ